MMHRRTGFLPLALAIFLVNCGGGGGGGSASLPATATATPAVPTATPFATATPQATSTPASSGTLSSGAFACPANASATAELRGPASATGDAGRRPVSGTRAGAASQGSSLIAVTYDRGTATRSSAAISARERTLGTQVASYDFSHANLATHVISVPQAQLESAMTALRAQSGVTSVALAGGKRYATTVTQPYFPNDPYFNGFQTTVASGGVTPPATYHVAPYDASASVPGQWDMHAIKLEYAYGYSQSGNGSGIVNTLALGSRSVKIAVIDTGEDFNSPDLAQSISYQRCYITGSNNVQSTSNFSNDPTGHGTDVAGLAAATMNNSFGFAGSGGNSSIYAYRVFPRPDDACENSSTTTDDQCGSDTRDIASAIEDAIAQHVNVITMSLGGGSCTNGVDGDSTEGNAVADAIAANIIVIAASGNDGSSPVSAPGCDTSVIAVGASALADGQRNGSGVSGSASSPVEYVASYSDWGSPASNVKSASAWGIVAPGGDPNGSSDADDLHWIENLWTSTPFDSTYAGSCGDDYPNSLGTTAPLDCRTLIAGTSMATPHVAGAAALILAVNASYQSPARMKQLLCSTADDINSAHQGCGRLNVYRAMAVAIGDSNPP